MKFKDYIRLGKISVKSRKKSTRNTAFGLSFALILLIPIIFFTLSFTIDLTTKVNERKTISTFDIETISERESIYSVGFSSGLLIGQNDLKSIIDNDSVEEYTGYEYLNFSYRERKNVGLKFSVDNMNFEYSYDDLNNNNIYVKNSIKVLTSGTNPIGSSYVHDLTKGGLSSFTGKGFTGNGKGQIIVSEYLLSKKGLSASNVIGKKLSLYASLTNMENNIFIDNDNNPNNQFDPNKGEYYESEYKIIKDFEIVGVVSEDYYKMNYKTRNDSHFFITGSSLYVDNEAKYKPIITEIESPYEGDKHDDMKFYLATYKEDISNIIESANEEKMIPLLMPSITYNSNNPTAPITTYRVVYNNFSEASKVDDKITSIGKTLGNNAYNPFASSEFQSFKMLDTIGTYMALGLSIFAGIILFATLLNLYNTINYSVESRRNFIGMMRAIGQKNISIVKSYIVEILLIFRKALLWILLFSAPLSFLLKFGIDQIFINNDNPLPITISLDFTYYFITLGVVLVFSLLIALLFSYVCCRPVTKKSILDVLVEDK